MEKEDARKQSREVLHERRKQVIRLHRKGVGVMQIVEQTGLSWSGVNTALRLFEQGGANDTMRAARLLRDTMAAARREHADETSWRAAIEWIRSHPVLALAHEDPFVHRCWRKPRGYAGDAELLEEQKVQLAEIGLVAVDRLNGLRHGMLLGRGGCGTRLNGDSVCL